MPSELLSELEVAAEPHEIGDRRVAGPRVHELMRHAGAR